MNGPRAVTVYRALLRLYPRAFRDQYGPDMALLFSHQLREEPAVRVWARGAIDLAITLPGLHLETHMNRRSHPTVPIAFAALSLTGLLLAIVGGSGAAMLTVGLSLAAASGVLAVFAWRNTRTITSAHPVAAQWWKFLAGGAGVLAAVIVAINIVDELPDGLWWPMMITLTLALASLATGLVLGFAHRTGSRQHHVAG